MRKNKTRTIIATLFTFIVLFPILYAFSASFFPMDEFTSIPARFFPTRWTPPNYIRAFSSSSLPRYLTNSLISAILGTTLRMMVCLLAAYSLTVFHYKGRYAIFLILTATMLLPGDALLLQNYITVQRMGLADTYRGLIVTAILSPTALFLLRQYFLTVSSEYREAAYLEGCSDMRFLFTMLIPMSQSVVVALVVQSFTQFFNDYLWPLLITGDERMRTVQVGITMLGFAESFDYGPLLAAIITLTLPMVLLVFLTRKKINESISTRFSGR